MRNMQSLPYSDVVFKASIVRLYVYSPLKEQSNPFQFYGINFFLFLTCFWLLHNQDFQDGVQKVKGEEKITCRLKHYAFCCMQCLFLSTLFSFNGLSAFANLPRIARLSATFLHSSHKLLIRFIQWSQITLVNLQLLYWQLACNKKEYSLEI